jgi:hypothetical protein
MRTLLSNLLGGSDQIRDTLHSNYAVPLIEQLSLKKNRLLEALKGADIGSSQLIDVLLDYIDDIEIKESVRKVQDSKKEGRGSGKRKITLYKDDNE